MKDPYYEPLRTKRRVSVWRQADEHSQPRRVKEFYVLHLAMDYVKKLEKEEPDALFSVKVHITRIMHETKRSTR